MAAWICPAPSERKSGGGVGFWAVVEEVGASVGRGERRRVGRRRGGEEAAEAGGEVLAASAVGEILAA